VVWRPCASGYIEADNAPACCDSWLIRNSVDRLADQPHSGRPGGLAGTRELVVPGTSWYRIHAGRLDLTAIFQQKSPKRL
jgi:plasmid stabilization system protein ParE